MLLPALNKARDAANKLSCMSNVRQIVAVFHMYANDNKGSLPPLAPDIVYSEVNLWFIPIMSYFSRDDGELGRDWLRCTARLTDGWFTYGVNYTAVKEPAVFTYGDPSGSDPLRRYNGSGKLPRISPSTILVMDASNYLVYSPAHWQFDNAPDYDSYSTFISVYGGRYNFAEFMAHKMTMNVGLADGSARNVTLASWKANEDQMWGYPTP